MNVWRIAWAAAAVVVTCATSVLGGVIDPPWTRGGPFTTFQYWTFSNPSNPIAPDGWENPNGPPHMNPSGSTYLLNNPLSPVTGTGVWCVPDGGSLSFFIPNFNLQMQKEIFVALKYSVPPAGVGVPTVSIMGIDGNPGTPSGPTYTPSPVPGMPGVSQIAYGFTMPTCSSFLATITFPVGIPGSVGYIEQVVFDTRCIPTPSSIGLLAVAGLTIMRRRR